MYNDMVASSGLEHIGDEFGSYWRAGFILLVLSRVRKTGDDGSDASRRGSSTGIYHYQQLHEMIVDIIRSSLQDENILISDRFAYCI
jgi:hypothetical protein